MKEPADVCDVAPRGAKCRVCEQALLYDESEEMRDHHLRPSPIDSALCLGCWVGWLEVENFIIRSTGRTFWTRQTYDIMRQFLKLAREHKF